MDRSGGYWQVRHLITDVQDVTLGWSYQITPAVKYRLGMEQGREKTQEAAIKLLNAR